MAFILKEALLASVPYGKLTGSNGPKEGMGLLVSSPRPNIVAAGLGSQQGNPHMPLDSAKAVTYCI